MAKAPRVQGSESAVRRPRKSWIPAPLMMVANGREIQSVPGAAKAADELLHSDLRSIVRSCWEQLSPPLPSGRLTVSFQTSFPQGALPDSALERVGAALTSSLRTLFAGARTTDEVKLQLDAGELECRLEFQVAAPAVKELALGERTGQDSAPGKVPLQEQDSNKDELRDKVRAALRKLLPGRQEPPATRMAAISNLQSAIVNELASDFQEPLQAVIKEMPAETRAEKQAICTFVNGTLRRLGMAIRCPKTGRPALLMADQKQADSEVSRFRLEIRDETGKKTRTFSSTTLPTLELRQDEPRAEPLVEWTQRIKKSEKNQQRE